MGIPIPKSLTLTIISFPAIFLLIIMLVPEGENLAALVSKLVNTWLSRILSDSIKVLVKPFFIILCFSRGKKDPLRTINRTLRFYHPQLLS